MCGPVVDQHRVVDTEEQVVLDEAQHVDGERTLEHDDEHDGRRARRARHAAAATSLGRPVGCAAGRGRLGRWRAAAQPARQADVGPGPSDRAEGGTREGSNFSARRAVLAWVLAPPMVAAP